jgi:hypothetical protein
MEQALPLSRGDLRWVFPDLEDPGPVSNLLSHADGLISSLAHHLGVSPGRHARALEYVRIDGITLPGVYGRVETGDVSFSIGMGTPRRCLWDQRFGPPWEVTATVEVTCEQGAECGLHIVEDHSESCRTPLQAAQALMTAAHWLHERGTAEPAGSWRAKIHPCQPAARN